MPGPSITALTQPHGAQPLIVAHRGASGYRPEHTLAAYELGARIGADFIEPDLVPTRDGFLVARHENEISATTDVASRPEFAGRRIAKTIDGQQLTGWFTEDFTLAELRSLRAVERIPEIRQHNTIYNGRYQVVTLDEVAECARRLSRELGRPIGVLPEIKHSTYFQSIGLAIEPLLVQFMQANGLDNPNNPDGRLAIQSFEVANLRELNQQVTVPLVQLTAASGAPYDFIASGDPRTYDDLTTPGGLAGVASYADVIAPAKDQIIPRRDDGALGEPTTVVADAHAVGLLVSPWTFRNENAFLPTALRSGGDDAAYGEVLAEYERFIELGVDAVFSDQPDTAVEARG